MEEEKNKNNTSNDNTSNDNMDNAIADTILHYQNLYEEEKRKREEAVARVVEMTKALRNMSVVKDQSQDDKKLTSNEILKKLF